MRFVLGILMVVALAGGVSAKTVTFSDCGFSFELPKSVGVQPHPKFASILEWKWKSVQFSAACNTGSEFFTTSTYLHPLKCIGNREFEICLDSGRWSGGELLVFGDVPLKPGKHWTRYVASTSDFQNLQIFGKTETQDQFDHAVDHLKAVMTTVKMSGRNEPPKGRGHALFNGPHESEIS